ncbi:Phosphoglycerate kinase, chloroplastic [Sesamum alatum]|uniref:Phosphoglycerate kinase n=1 Tax=Sesamum alatum TaxID=300844 RepID=A0AAE1Z1C3_9LAMI|nr:Phosphoglycerate kinase, chloroplastic [Sesamum alatum]
MASTAASPAFCGIPKASTSTATRASIPATRFLAKNPLRGLGFSAAAAEPLLSHHVATKLRSFSAKPVRGVASMAKKSVGDLSAADLKGKKVFVRADLNVPLDDNQTITDDTRIRAAVPTIKHLISNGAKVILSSHLGRPKGVTPKYSLAPLVPRLSELLGIQVVKADDCIGPEVEKLVASLPEGGVLLLENVRFYKEEEKNEPEFAKKLASLADLFVNDAFGTAHRAHASTEGVTKFLKPSVAGFLLQKELDYLVGAVSSPKRPFAAIVGGSKVSSKIGVIESLLEKCDILLLGGGMIFTFYKAQGLSVGSSLVEEDKLELATSLLEKAKAKGVSLLLPTDVVIADKFAPDANSKVVPASAIPDGWMGLDIGPDSCFEFDKFAVGTEAIANKLAELSGNGVTTIIGGGDSVAAVEKVGVASVMSHISTGGGASLELLEGKELPGVLALDEATPVAVNFFDLSTEMATKKSVGSLKEADLKGKRVLVRVDLNVPLDDNFKITDDTRIRAAVPTIKYLMEHGAKVILTSHLGRPKGVTPKYSLKPLVPRLSELLGLEVKMANDCIGEEVEKLVAGLPEGGVLLLENVRFYKEEEKNDPEFAKKLASLADLYVNDAFGTAHRAHASTEGVAKYLKPSVAGFLMQKELDYLVGAVANPKKPFAAIVGGSKVSSKIGVIESLLEKVDILLLGGGMIFTFYKAQGHAVGSSLVEADKLDLATSLMEKAKTKGVSLLLPSDVVIADKFAADANSKVVPASQIPDGWMGLDIGPDSIKSFGEALDTTKTIIWNGPMGVFEFDKFAAGTEAIAKKLAELSVKGVTTIIGGGDSVAAVEKVGLADKMSHISTGGGASLELLEGKTLPGVLALNDA